MDLEFNDAAMVDTQGTGWFLGYSEWVRDKNISSALRYMPQNLRSRGLCMKWMIHRKGDHLGGDKPLSEGRTLSIMVSESGRFRIQFARQPNFPEHHVVEHVLRKPGHFSVWGAGIYHRWFVDEDCTILTLRWIPEGEGDAGMGTVD